MPNDKPGVVSVEELESTRKDKRKFKITLNVPATPRHMVAFLQTTIDIPKIGSKHPDNDTQAARMSFEMDEGKQGLSDVWIVTISYKW